LPALGDVARNFRRADDLALSIFDRRDRQRNIDAASILVLTQGFEVLDLLSPPDALENLQLLILPVRWNENRDRFADYFFRRISEYPLRALVPAGDNAVEVLADDGVVGGFDDRDEPMSGLLGAFAVADVDQHVDCADDLARRIMQRSRKRDEGNAGAVRSLRHGFRAAYRAARLQGHRHRAFVVRHRPAVRPIQAPRATPPILADLGAASPHRHRRVIEERDAPTGVGRIDRRRQAFDDGTEMVVALSQRLFVMTVQQRAVRRPILPLKRCAGCVT
jgi:hypothetical protein